MMDKGYAVKDRPYKCVLYTIIIQSVTTEAYPTQLHSIPQATP